MQFGCNFSIQDVQFTDQFTQFLYFVEAGLADVNTNMTFKNWQQKLSLHSTFLKAIENTFVGELRTLLFLMLVATPLDQQYIADEDAIYFTLYERVCKCNSCACDSFAIVCI